VKDFIKLVLCGLLVSIGLALGAIFGGGKLFLSFAFLLFLGFIMPYSLWKYRKHGVPIPKIYFLVSGTFGFLIYLVLWLIHGTQGSSPINLLDMVITFIVWRTADFQIKKIFKITD
jgi:hypothetical protein